MVRQVQGNGSFGPQFRQHPHHLRDDFSGFAHNHRVTEVQIQFGDAISVVQGGAADAGARQGHRLEFGHRRHGAGASHLHHQLQQLAGGFFRWIFQGNGPAWGLLGGARLILKTQVVELHHHAIGGVRQLMALLLPAVAEAFDSVQAIAELAVGIDAKPRLLEPLQHLPLVCG